MSRGWLNVSILSVHANEVQNIVNKMLPQFDQVVYLTEVCKVRYIQYVQEVVTRFI